MLDSALLKTNFVGRDGFVWWIGRVADPEVWRNESTDTDAGWAFRCKVRIIGYHPFDEQVMPEVDLPWAHVLVDATSGSGQGCFGESSRMVGGETVFGFFMDGEEAQQPVVFGALARTINEEGPENADMSATVGAERSAFGVASGRIGGLTTMPNTKNKTGGTPTGNAENKHGEESGGELKDGREGVSKSRKSDQVFSDTQLGPHTAENGCKDDAIGDIAHALGSFLTTVNSLTEFAGVYIDAAQNLIGDVQRLLGKVSRLISAAIKKIINKIRDKVVKLLSKLFKNLQALIVPEPQKPMISKALQKIIDIIFCLFNTSWGDLFNKIKDMLKDMIGKAINPTVCAIEQMVGNLLADIYDKIGAVLKPVMDGLSWLSSSLGKVMNLFGKISSYIDMILSFLSCTGLSCKEYEDWSQGWGLSTKPAGDMASVLDNVEIFKKMEEFADGASYTGTGVYDARTRFSLLSMLGGEYADFFDCNEKTRNPKTQDDLGNGVPPGFTWSECIPPKVEVHGDGTKTAALIPIVSSIDGSILTLEIIEPGKNYSVAPQVTIVDKTRNGGGAIAEAIIDDNGSIVDIYMIETGEGYCPATNVVPPKYPVTESPDEEAPYITFTTPADDAVGVQTSVSLSITFSEPILKGRGDITITESLTNVVQERIPVRDSRISFLSDRIIRVDPESNLSGNTEYYITMSEGSFLDKENNQFAGIARTDTYNFTTRGVSGIGSEAVGIVTSLVPYRPGIGYQPGDNGQVGACTFDLVLTPAGSIAGINNINCQDKHKTVPAVTINTRTGLGAELIPIISYSPDFVSDSGAAPTIDGGVAGGRSGISAPMGAMAGGSLFVKVIDCVYSLDKTQIGWVNGNAYYGEFHVHNDVKMVGAVHLTSPHPVIYNTREESLGQAAPVNYTPNTNQTYTAPTTSQTNVSDTTTTSQPDTSNTTPTQQVEPQQTTQPTTPQQQTPPSTPPPTNPPTGGGGSGGSGGGGYGGGY